MKVLRVLVFEGPDDWIKSMLEKTWLQPNSESRGVYRSDADAKEILRTSDPAHIMVIEALAHTVGQKDHALIGIGPIGVQGKIEEI